MTNTSVGGLGGGTPGGEAAWRRSAYYFFASWFRTRHSNRGKMISDLANRDGHLRFLHSRIITHAVESVLQSTRGRGNTAPVAYAPASRTIELITSRATSTEAVGCGPWCSSIASPKQGKLTKEMCWI